MTISRREFLRMAGLAAAGAACGSGTKKQPLAANSPAESGKRTLRIAQWSHYVPGYDDWFDKEYVVGWGERNDIEVVVDHFAIAELPSRAAAEVASRRGHDLFSFLSPPAAFEDETLDLRDLVEDVRAKIGPIAPLLERTAYNPKTKKWFGFPDFWSPFPVNYRSDLWQAVGARPDSWEDVVVAGRKLKAAGHPIGIGMSQELDSNSALIALMYAHGASVQDEEANVTLNSPATIEAIKTAVALYREGMTDEVFNWDPSSNNRLLTSGRASLIVNPVSALRAVEKQDAALAQSIALAPALAGPAGRFGIHGGIGVSAIWRFAENQEIARRFIVDFALDAREALIRSEFFNMPAFPGAVPDLGDLVAADPQARPADKYAILAGAEDWSTNYGHPGYANAAVDEVFNLYVIPQMFAAAARGELTPEEAVRAAEQRVQPIYDKWRERGKI